MERSDFLKRIFAEELMMRMPYGVMVADTSGLETRRFKPTAVYPQSGHLEWFDFVSHVSRHSEFNKCKLVLRPVAFLVAKRQGHGSHSPFVGYAMQSHLRKFKTVCQVQSVCDQGEDVTVTTIDGDGNLMQHRLSDLVSLKDGIDALRFLLEKHVDFQGIAKQELAVIDECDPTAII